MGFQTTFCKTSWTPIFHVFLPYSPCPPGQCWKPAEKKFPTRDASFSNMLGIFNIDLGGRGEKNSYFFRGPNNFAKGCIYIGSKAIYRTNDADLIACMQAIVISTRVQELPQLRPLAEITRSSENVLFVPNCKG